MDYIVETLKHPASAVGWVARLSQMAYPGESNLNFCKSQWVSTIVTSQKNLVLKLPVLEVENILRVVGVWSYIIPRFV